MKGFTLLEILVAIAIIVLVTTLLGYVLSSFGESNKLTEADLGVIGMLRDARARTMASKSSSNYGVHFETTKAVLFQGNIYDQGNALNESYVLPSGTEISAITLTGGATEVVFTRLYGTTTASGTVTLISKKDSSKTRTVTIFSTGGIK